MSDEKISRFCMECGEQVGPGEDFCYRCGSRRIVNVNLENNRVVLKKGQCPFCNNFNNPEDGFCSKCGQRIGEFEYSGRSRPLDSTDYLTIILALVPGIFNLFGLGHIVLRQYSRAFMYLGISAVLLYLRWFAPGSTVAMRLAVEIVGLIVFMKQAFEVLGSVQRKRGGR